MIENLKEIQEKTCKAIEKEYWMQPYIQQVINAAEKGERSTKFEFAETPIKGFDEEWSKIIDYFMMRGFGVKIEKNCDLFISWSPNYHYNQSGSDRIELAIQGLTYVLCQVAEAIATGDEEARKVLIEEVRTIANGMPDGFIGLTDSI